jgi:dihydroorotase
LNPQKRLKPTDSSPVIMSDDRRKFRTKVKSLVIKGGRIIDPGQGIDEVGDLLITAGKISALGKPPSPLQDYDVLNATGLIVCPGFIDLHCHLRQPGFEEKETIATGTRAAARGGFTTVCCMPNTSPPLDNRDTVEYVKKVAAKESAVRVLPIGCVSKGRQGKELVDMAELESAGVIGFSDDGDPISSPQLMRQALDYSRALGLPVIDHCEDKTLTEGGQINEGIISLELGLRGIPAAAEERMVHRNLALARQAPGCRLHIAHVSTGESVELLRHAKELGISVTAEVTPHHLTLTEEAALGYNTNAKVSPPLRTKRDIEALLQGLKEDVIDIIATDHAPHTAADKNGKFIQAAFGISGLETAFGSLMMLVHNGELVLNNIIAKLTYEPAKILSKDLLGTLKIGSPADITVFDLHKEWLVDTSAFASKGKNTPLAGQTLKGKVMATIFQGNPVYLDEGIKIITASTEVNI